MTSIFLRVCQASPVSCARWALRGYNGNTHQRHFSQVVGHTSIKKPGCNSFETMQRHLSQITDSFCLRNPVMCLIRGHTHVRYKHTFRTQCGTVFWKKKMPIYQVITRNMNKNSSKVPAKSPLPQRSELFRLIALAKPERWRILGKFFVSSSECGKTRTKNSDGAAIQVGSFPR